MSNQKQGQDSHDKPRPAVDRRDFLRLAGFSVGMSFLSDCRQAPVEHAVPVLEPSEELVPGRPLDYATICRACPAGCGILATCVDGRPIKLEGNPDHPVSRGGMCAVGQASILELYDTKRLREPLAYGHPVDWPILDRQIIDRLTDLTGQKTYFLSGTVNSPTTEWMIRSFLERRQGQWITYDAFSHSAILQAHLETHGFRALPYYDLGKAEVIIGVNADFLGTWISPVEFAQGYRTGRSLEGSRLRLSTHWQFESGLSLTGCRADRRIALHPAETRPFLAALAKLVALKAGQETGLPDVTAPVEEGVLEGLVDLLWNNRGKTLLMCGDQDLPCQVLTNLINHLLQNYGRTLDLNYPSFQRKGDESQLETLRQDLRERRVGALFVAGVNPVYDLPFGQELADLLGPVPLLVSFSGHLDETARLADYVCPEPHYLETWGDAAPTARTLSLSQPTIGRLGATRPLIESLSVWMGRARSDFELVRQYWEEQVIPRRYGFGSFDQFWNQALHDGQAQIRPVRSGVQPFDFDAVRLLALSDSEPGESSPDGENGGTFLLLRPSRTIGDVSHGHNPWLQELPDPLTRTCWGNHLELAPDRAAEMEIETGDLVEVFLENGEDEPAPPITLPAVVQPGLAHHTMVIALGYGGETSRRLSGLGPDWLEAKRPPLNQPIGKRASDLISYSSGRLSYDIGAVHMRRTGRRETLARVQLEDREGARSDGFGEGTGEGELVREMKLTDLLSTRPEIEEGPAPSLWPEDHLYSGSHWRMAIDLGACTGCSACVVACQAENNIPAVGRDEVRRNRSMHWLRIDRYLAGDEQDPDVRFLPLLCQHCDRAPCETVCPVLATVHGEEGLNEQIYNRCIGTRFCANNCPYKVRVFNWFDYSHEVRLENLQLNPSVTVRSRGVMEKCSFCVQRIQRAKHQAIVQRRKLADGEIQPACQQTCPSRAIVFGDLNDPESAVSKLAQNPRSYLLLGELGTRPSIGYLAMVRNQTEKGEADG